MASDVEPFTVGVEEEYQLIHPQTRHLSTRSSHILPIAQAALGDRIVQPEFRQSQLEIATPICRSLRELRTQLYRLRNDVIATAIQNGNQIAAAGTHPFSHWQDQLITPKPQYQTLVQRYQRLMQELVTFGCHVHVGISDREMAVQIMNRARIWLAPVLALSASSPFWLGTDTGYASYRTVLISRLPMAGPPLLFESYTEYNTVVRSLVATNTIQNAAQICWDIRLSEHYPTLEFRMADMCMTVNESVMIAGLIRGLVRTCYEQECLHIPYKAARPELFRAAHWYAARSGLDAELIDIDTETCIPAHQLIEKLLEFVRPALEAFGEWHDVYDGVCQTLQHGTGATRQRKIYQETGSLEEVVDFIIQETARTEINNEGMNS